MQSHAAIKASILLLTIGFGTSAVHTFAQAPGVTIARDHKGHAAAPLRQKAEALRTAGALLSLDEVTNQLRRTSCKIALPPPQTTELTSREIWTRAQQAHVQVGWHYRCNRCEKWHQSLAGGYFVSTNGMIATCHHVLSKDREAYREAYLVAADNQGNILPILEVMAADKGNDTAIIRAKVEGEVTALPLNRHVFPGDDAWCYSDPLGRSGYFSKGIVNRFYLYGREAGEEFLRMEVSTDWAPGSSGAAVLDTYGNAIGHVSEISSAGTRKKKPRIRTQHGSTNIVGQVQSEAPNAMMIFHCAARAADVLALVE